MKIRTALAACLLASFVFCSSAAAHFPWLKVDKDGKASLFFGENIADQTYKLPPSVQKAKLTCVVSGKSQELATDAVQSDDFVGLVAKESLGKAAVVSSHFTYGLYHEARLNYSATHVHGSLPTEVPSEKATKQKGLAGELVQTKEGVDVLITWNGKALAEVDVQLYCQEGHEEAAATTDKDGRVSFTSKEVESGLNGIVFGHTTEEAGELDGESYKSAMHYATITFVSK